MNYSLFPDSDADFNEEKTDYEFYKSEANRQNRVIIRN